MKDYETIYVLHRCGDCDRNIAGKCMEYLCDIFEVSICTYEVEKEITLSDRLFRGFRMLSDEYEGE